MTRRPPGGVSPRSRESTLPRLLNFLPTCSQGLDVDRRYGEARFWLRSYLVSHAARTAMNAPGATRTLGREAACRLAAIRPVRLLVRSPERLTVTGPRSRGTGVAERDDSLQPAQVLPGHRIAHEARRRGDRMSALIEGEEISHEAEPCPARLAGQGIPFLGDLPPQGVLAAAARAGLRSGRAVRELGPGRGHRPADPGPGQQGLQDGALGGRAALAGHAGNGDHAAAVTPPRQPSAGSRSR